MHTPGPWRACEKLSGSENHRGWSIFADKVHIETPAPLRCVVIGEIYPGGSDPTPEAKANARLIAAAPDLLAACDDALNTLIGSCVAGPGCDDRADILRTQANLRAAIAKAEGQTASTRPSEHAGRNAAGTKTGGEV